MLAGCRGAGGLSSGGGFHCGEQIVQPAWRFWVQSLIACSRVSSLRRLSSGGSPLTISSPSVTSSAWLQRLERTGRKCSTWQPSLIQPGPVLDLVRAGRLETGERDRDHDNHDERTRVLSRNALWRQ